MIQDSGTSLLTGPSDAIAKIADMLGAKKVIKGEYMVPCSSPKLVNIQYTIHGHTMVLEPKDYLIQSAGSVCLLGLIGLDVPRYSVCDLLTAS